MTPTHDLFAAWAKVPVADRTSWMLGMIADSVVAGLPEDPEATMQPIEAGLAAGHSLFTIAQNVVELSDEF
jgi:hypothetical protein